ncbi:MAG: radical SAM protein [Chloroflexi bacterium]|nr:radical SAM protein [Chloroflexota bacterium]
MTWKAVQEARQRLDSERGTTYKDWGGKIHIALIYPNSYYLGMSNLGFQTIYRLLNSYDNIVCERVFWEPKRGKTDEPISLESQRPLPDFDVLAFSISYELDYFNVIQVLKESGIPLLASDRDERHPLLIAGGPCVTANPLPLSPFFDCFAIGEGEAIVPRFIEVITDGVEDKKDRLLKALASVPGVYVPTQYSSKPVKRQWLKDLDSAATTSVILTPDTEFGDMYLIEIARGCGWGCRFCLAGFQFRPFRYWRLESLVQQAENGLKYTNKIGLLAAAVSDYPEIDELAHTLHRMDVELSVSSLRFRPFSQAVLKALAKSGAQTITLAPEAGSERLRRIINKCVTEDDIIEAVDRIAKQGIRQIKLYFMIGLPTETDTDIDEIVRLSLALRGRTEGTLTRLAITVEPFVPKAGTPFQWLAMAKEDVLTHRLNRIKSSLTKKGIEVRAESAGWSIVQGVLARGDDKLGAVLANMQRSSLAAWRRALKEANLSPDYYVHRELTFNEPLPWSVLDSGVKFDYLSEELQKAHRSTETSPCPTSECHKCGVC